MTRKGPFPAIFTADLIIGSHFYEEMQNIEAVFVTVNGERCLQMLRYYVRYSTAPNPSSLYCYTLNFTSTLTFVLITYAMQRTLFSLNKRNLLRIVLLLLHGWHPGKILQTLI